MGPLKHISYYPLKHTLNITSGRLASIGLIVNVTFKLKMVIISILQTTCAKQQRIYSVVTEMKQYGRCSRGFDCVHIVSYYH